MSRIKENEKYDLIQLKLTAKEKQVIQNMASRKNMNVTKFMHDLIFRSGLINISGI